MEIMNEVKKVMLTSVIATASLVIGDGNYITFKFDENQTRI